MGEWRRNLDADAAEAEALRTRMIALQPLGGEAVRHAVAILPQYIARVRELEAEVRRLNYALTETHRRHELRDCPDL